jgi:hypothetical protein
MKNLRKVFYIDTIDVFIEYGAILSINPVVLTQAEPIS